MQLIYTNWDKNDTSAKYSQNKVHQINQTQKQPLEIHHHVRFESVFCKFCLYACVCHPLTFPLPAFSVVYSWTTKLWQNFGTNVSPFRNVTRRKLLYLIIINHFVKECGVNFIGFVPGSV